MESRDLYRWKRWSTTPTTNSTYLNEKKKTKDSSSDDIQEWIKKVEKASDRAAAMTFGPSSNRHGDFSVANGYGSAAATLEALHDHDEAHSEAQDLLSQWMAQKCGLDDNDEDDLRYFEDDDEIRQYSATKQAAKSELKGQWHSMLAENDPVGVDPYNNVTSEELFHEIETRDDDQAVKSIINNLMQKELVETKFRKDLGLGGETTKKKHDPRATMAARQQKVRENREKRQQTRETHLRQQQQHKDTQSQARQLVMKEDRNKALKRQREETMIQQEMARLRKEMQEQRRLEEETRQREKDLDSRWNEEVRQEEATRRREDLHTRLKAESLIEEERRKMKHKLEDARVLKASRDLKSLQRHFHAWYQLVLTKRLALAKARALSDWRTILRAWNAWRAYIRANQAERETREVEKSFKVLHRKNQIATDHSRKTILKKYFQVWCLWLHQGRHSKELTEQQNQTKSKMAAFLEAAASGKLWTNRSKEERMNTKEGRKEAPDRPDSATQKLDALFEGKMVHSQANPRAALSTARSDTSTISNTPSDAPRSRHHSTDKPGKPKYAWQVTRKHVDLPIEDILTAGHDEAGIDGETQPNRNQNNAAQDGKITGNIPSPGQKKNINYKLNSFEHRYAAQQQILHEQQHQLREQKRLIEDLQTTQKQQVLKMQVGDYRGPPSDITTDQRSEATTCTGLSTARSDHSDSSSTVGSAGEKTKEMKKPPLLKGMKEREAVRLKLKAEREERQRQKEQEKLAEIKAKEDRQREEEGTEKRAKIEKRREEKRLAKQCELEKQQRIEHQRLQNSRADEHYKRTLLRRKGLDPWLRLMDLAKQNMQVAEDHHNSLLLKRCLLPWQRHTDEVTREKIAMADQLNEVILIRRAFNCWTRYGHLQSIQLQKARRHYGHALKGRVFKAWQQHVTDEKLRMWRNEEIAENHNEMRIFKTAFLVWKQYPKILKAERLREKRLQDMRKKVASILPDFGNG